MGTHSLVETLQEENGASWLDGGRASVYVLKKKNVTQINKYYIIFS